MFVEEQSQFKKKKKKKLATFCLVLKPTRYQNTPSLLPTHSFKQLFITSLKVE